MPAFDASSIIYAWDNYPQNQFPQLWNWMANQIHTKKFVIPISAFEEVKHKLPELAQWLREQNIECLQVTNAVIQEALRIQQLLGITQGNYHPKGVNEYDILIIATAYVEALELVSDEARQTILPNTKSKMKIPAVCRLDEIQVPCINFLELVKISKVIFG